MFGRRKEHLTYQQGHDDGYQVGRAHGKEVGRATFAAQVILLIESMEAQPPEPPEGLEKMLDVDDEYTNHVLAELKNEVIKLVIAPDITN
jgi:hypothetical protein